MTKTFQQKGGRKERKGEKKEKKERKYRRTRPLCTPSGLIMMKVSSVAMAAEVERCEGDDAKETRESERETHTHTKQRRNVRSFISLTFHPQDDSLRDLDGFFNEND
jgi:hypothetical protein